MRFLKKHVAIFLIVLMAWIAPTSSPAKEYCTDTGGCAYEDTYSACCIAPAVIFALALLAAIIAVGVHNRHKSSHAHNDSDD